LSGGGRWRLVRAGRITPMSEASNQAADERRRGSARRDRPVARLADTTAGERMRESNRARDSDVPRIDRGERPNGRRKAGMRAGEPRGGCGRGTRPPGGRAMAARMTPSRLRPRWRASPYRAAKGFAGGGAAEWR